MDNQHHIHYTRHHPGFGYAVSLGARVYSIIFAPFLFLAGFFVLLWLIGKVPVFNIQDISPSFILKALGLSLLRLSVAYMLSLIVALPLALMVTRNALMGRIFLPFFDVLESVPVLAFFPLLVLFFVQTGYLEGAAIFILFLGMVWNIVFSLVGGLKVIPTEIKSAAQVFGIRGQKYLWWVLLPAVVPYLITGSLLAWAQGWNILIIAEVLHTYLPGGTAAQDLMGIGNLLVQASAGGQEALFMYLLVVLTATVALMNFFIWQKLLKYAEQFRFD